MMTSLTSFSVMFGAKAKKSAAPKKAAKPTADNVQAKLEKGLANQGLGKVKVSIHNFPNPLAKPEIIVTVYKKYVDPLQDALAKLCGKGKPSTLVCGKGTKARKQFSLDGFTVKVQNFLSKATRDYLDSTPNAGALCRKPGTGWGGAQRSSESW